MKSIPIFLRLLLPKKGWIRHHSKSILLILLCTNFLSCFVALQQFYLINRLFTSSASSIMPDSSMKSAVFWNPSMSSSLISREKS